MEMREFFCTIKKSFISLPGGQLETKDYVLRGTTLIHDNLMHSVSTGDILTLCSSPVTVGLRLHLLSAAGPNQPTLTLQILSRSSEASSLCSLCCLTPADSSLNSGSKVLFLFIALSFMMIAYSFRKWKRNFSKLCKVFLNTPRKSGKNGCQAAALPYDSDSFLL